MDKNKTGQDNREFPRIPKNVTMSVKRLQYPLANVDAKPAITKDVTSMGVCFITSELYEPGSLLSVEIDLRGWQQYLQNVFAIIDAATITKSLTAIAEVVWSKELSGEQGYKVGIRFKDIYEDDLQALQKHLTKILEKQAVS